MAELIGECKGCVLGRVYVCGVWWSKVSLAPLYYPDTLVNPDTCLGVRQTSKYKEG